MYNCYRAISPCKLFQKILSQFSHQFGCPGREFPIRLYYLCVASARGGREEGREGRGGGEEKEERKGGERGGEGGRRVGGGGGGEERGRG